MDVIEAIHTRRSVRIYQSKEVPETVMRDILAAAMSAPSAGNEQPWHFVVITDRDILNQIPRLNPHASMARRAAVAVLVCGDTSLEKFPGCWVLDCAAAAQNLLLAAHAKGLGAVWTGVYPARDRMTGFSRLLSLPETVMPHTLIPMGYPAQRFPAEDRYRKDRVHYNIW